MQEKSKKLKKSRRSVEVLNTEEHNGKVIVLGRDSCQYMIGIEYKDQIVWKKFFTDLPPADKFGGAGGLAREYFHNPDKYADQFGALL
jgi:hypothetical protein